MLTTSMTTNKNDSLGAGEILKVDVLGRVTVPREKREELLDTFEKSGMSGAQFAQHHGIHVQTFASWIQKRRRARGDYENEEMRRKLRMGKKTGKAPRKSRPKNSPSNTALNLIEVVADAPAPCVQALEVILPSGVVLKVSSVDQVTLLKTLISELSC